MDLFFIFNVLLMIEAINLSSIPITGEVGKELKLNCSINAKIVSWFRGNITNWIGNTFREKLCNLKNKLKTSNYKCGRRNTHQIIIRSLEDEDITAWRCQDYNDTTIYIDYTVNIVTDDSKNKFKTINFIDDRISTEAVPLTVIKSTITTESINEVTLLKGNNLEGLSSNSWASVDIIQSTAGASGLIILCLVVTLVIFLIRRKRAGNHTNGNTSSRTGTLGVDNHGCEIEICANPLYGTVSCDSTIESASPSRGDMESDFNNDQGRQPSSFEDPPEAIYSQVNKQTKPEPMYSTVQKNVKQ